MSVFSYNLLWWWEIVKWKLVKSSMVKISWRGILSGKDNEIPTENFDTNDLMWKIIQHLRKLDYSQNICKEEV